MSASLKKRCEKAIVAEMKKRPMLRTVGAATWGSDEPVKLLKAAVQATPQGEEVPGLYGYGVYPVDNLVTFRGLPRKGYDIGDYISEVEDMFREWTNMPDKEVRGLFEPYGLFMLAVIPRQAPASIEGSNRVDVTGIQFQARKI